MRRPDRAVRGARADAGSAVVEFLGVALVLLVPVVYLVLVLGTLQSAAFAVEGAAREAVRAYVTTAAHEQPARDPGGGAASGDAATARAGARALAAVGLALADQGLDDPSAQAVTLDCAPGCAAPGSSVTATVEVDVSLPGVPGWLTAVVPLSIPVSASATGTVEAFGGAP